MNRSQTSAKVVVSVLLILSLSGCDQAGEQHLATAADLVLVGGKIVTIDEANPEVEALAAKGGVITALGTRADIESHIGPSTEVIDLAGVLAVPGFIDGHGHFMGLGDSRLQLDLTTAHNWQRMEALKSATLDAAYGAFEDHLKGSLEVGKLADVTVLSKDILTVDEAEVPTAEVVYTIVGGEVVYRADR